MIDPTFRHGNLERAGLNIILGIFVDFEHHASAACRRTSRRRGIVSRRVFPHFSGKIAMFGVYLASSRRQQKDSMCTDCIRRAGTYGVVV